MNDARVRIKKILRALVSHPSSAVRRAGDRANAYPIRSWWWDKNATDELLEEADACLRASEETSVVDQILWGRYFIFWSLGRFEEAEADLLRLNRPDSGYRNEIGQPLGLIRKRKFPHEAV